MLNLDITYDVILYTSKKLRGGFHPLVLRLTQNRRHRYIALKEKISANDWDFERHSLKNKRNPDYNRLTNKINKVKLEVGELIAQFDKTGYYYDIDEIVKRFKPDKENDDVYEFIDRCIEDLKNTARTSTAGCYRDTKNSLKKFQPDKSITFRQVDARFLERWKIWHLSRGCKINTIGAYMRNLRTCYNMAIREGIIPKELYPFDKFKLSKLKERTPKRALKKEYIDKILQFKLDEFHECFHARNFFVFSYLCRGINITDYARLTEENFQVEEGIIRLRYVRNKTGDIFDIALIGEAIEIYKYYSERKTSSYVFPILNDAIHKTDRQQYFRIRKLRKYTNKNLKTMAKELGIEVNLTTYVARHSFATALKRKKVPISIISEMMGHQSELITKTYLEDFGKDELDEVSKVLLE